MTNKKSEKKNSLEKNEERINQIVKNVLSNADVPEEEKKWWKEWHNKHSLFLEKKNSKS